MDYGFAISLYDAHSSAYCNPRNAKPLRQDYQAAIDDYSKAIENNLYDPMSFNNRGHSKFHIKDYK